MALSISSMIIQCGQQQRSHQGVLNAPLSLQGFPQTFMPSGPTMPMAEALLTSMVLTISHPNIHAGTVRIGMASFSELAKNRQPGFKLTASWLSGLGPG